MNNSEGMVSTTAASTEDVAFPLSKLTLHPLSPYNTAIAIPAIILNSMVIKYYTKEYKKHVPSLYLIIAGCDILMTISWLFRELFLELSYGEKQDSVKANSALIFVCTACSGVPEHVRACPN